MSINLTVPGPMDNPELKPRITVLGVGGAGGNAVNNMIRRELEGVDFVVANTDAQSLAQSAAERRLQLGTHVTQGLGAGSKPEIGRAAAEETIEEVMNELQGTHMAFVAAGMGGGTGTGAAPVIAKAAREAGILTVGVVTKPFQFEGSHRMGIAEQGIADLEEHVDTLIIIPNQNLFRIANENTTFADAFNMADEVLYSGVRGVTDLIVMPGLINLDFADIRSVMSEMGKAMMGTGEAHGDRRALDAAEAAIANPLLEDTSMKGAKGVLINITGGQDVTLFEVDEAATRIRAEVDGDAHIIVGSAFDSSLDGSMRVSVVATGIDAQAARTATPTMLNTTDAYRVQAKPEVQVLELPEEPQPEEAPSEPATTESVSENTTQTAEGADVSQPQEENAETAVKPSTEERPLDQLIEEIDANAKTLDTMDAAAPTVETNLEEPEPEEMPASSETEVKTQEAQQPAPQAPADPVEPAVAAMPKIGAADAFIPQKAVSASVERKEADVDPYRAADMANGARGLVPDAAARTEEVRKPSLFERVTRTGRAVKEFAEGKPSGKSNADASKTEAVADAPSGRVTPIVSVSQPAPVGPSSATAMQAEMAGLQPQPEPVRQEVESEDDMLDIPAFLRRQAN